MGWLLETDESVFVLYIHLLHPRLKSWVNSRIIQPTDLSVGIEVKQIMQKPFQRFLKNNEYVSRLIVL